MVEVPVTGLDHPAKIDDDDAPLVLKHKWRNKDGYARTTVRIDGKSRSVYMHRLVMGVTDRSIFVDHGDGCRLNNQKHNLRKSTPLQNAKNRASSADSTSKYLGVSYNQGRKRWRVQIKAVQGKQSKSLGYYESEMMAASVYNEAAKKYHGEFARLNAVPPLKTLLEETLKDSLGRGRTIAFRYLSILE